MNFGILFPPPSRCRSAPALGSRFGRWPPPAPPEWHATRTWDNLPRDGISMEYLWYNDWLVVYLHPWKKFEFINWDDEIPSIWACEPNPAQFSYVKKNIWRIGGNWLKLLVGSCDFTAASIVSYHTSAGGSRWAIPIPQTFSMARGWCPGPWRGKPCCSEEILNHQSETLNPIVFSASFLNHLSSYQFDIWY